LTRLRFLPWAVAGALLLLPLMTSCGKENDVDAPAAPAPTPTPVVVATPTPTPAPTPAALGCGLPKGTGTGEGCPRTSPAFLAEVDRAINQVVAQNPQIFNLNDERGGGGYLILNRNRFYQEVVNNLKGMGLCAVDDGVEVAVKNVNSFSDQYRIDLSTGHIRRGESSYRATCFPAWF
jgi:hypothetical protein